ncbi:hypothetical protein chiPu_0021816, partial [Chiloscyllium punctatum]|nr:hypothetical protein [Chiloscyllium punctatum]
SRVKRPETPKGEKKTLDTDNPRDCPATAHAGDPPHGRKGWRGSENILTGPDCPLLKSGWGGGAQKRPTRPHLDSKKRSPSSRVRPSPPNPLRTTVPFSWSCHAINSASQGGWVFSCQICPLPNPPQCSASLSKIFLRTSKQERLSRIPPPPLIGHSWDEDSSRLSPRVKPTLPFANGEARASPTFEPKRNSSDFQEKAKRKEYGFSRRCPCQPPLGAGSTTESKYFQIKQLPPQLVLDGERS